MSAPRKRSNLTVWKWFRDAAKCNGVHWSIVFASISAPRSRSDSITSTWFLDAAKCSEVHWSILLASMSAPRSRSNFTASSWFCSAAEQSGVCCSMFLASMSAPRSRSNLITSTWFWDAAQCSEVHWLIFLASMLKPRSSSDITPSTCPFDAAEWSGSCWSMFFAAMSTPWSKCRLIALTDSPRWIITFSFSFFRWCSWFGSLVAMSSFSCTLSHPALPWNRPPAPGKHNKRTYAATRPTPNRAVPLPTEVSGLRIKVFCWAFMFLGGCADGFERMFFKTKSTASNAESFSSKLCKLKWFLWSERVKIRGSPVDEPSKTAASLSTRIIYTLHVNVKNLYNDLSNKPTFEIFSSPTILPTFDFCSSWKQPTLGFLYRCCLLTKSFLSWLRVSLPRRNVSNISSST